jgi:uncharacterized protein (TIGR00288 family)
MNEFNLRAPHRPAAPADAHSPHAALLIDFDNVTMGIRSNLGQELRKLLDSEIIRGKVSVQRAYADWRRYPQYIASLSEASIDLIFAPAYGSTKKNATDIRLAIDALEIVFIRPEIGTFILLSGDSDFSSLVLKLKEYGKYVIGVGIQESSSDLLVQNCDEYYSYTSLSGLTAASDMKNIEKHDPWELAATAIQRMTERGDVMRSDRFKQVMLELDPSFSEKSIGFSKFNRFLTESASRGILGLHKAANGQYEVTLGPRVDEYSDGGSGSAGSSKVSGSVPAPETPKKEREENRGRRRGRDDSRKADRADTSSSRRGRTRGRRDRDLSGEAPPSVDEDRLREAYELLRSVVAEKAGRGGAVRDSEVKRQLVAKYPDFDEAALGFRKFSRFLRQAHDEEIINLERTGEGNYSVSPLASDRVAEAPAKQPEPKEPEDKKEVSGDKRVRGRASKDRHERSGNKRGGDGPRADSGEPATDVAAKPVVSERAIDRSADQPEVSEHSAKEAEEAKDQGPTRLMGRKRRDPKPQAGAKVVPGPVDSEDSSRKAEPRTSAKQDAGTKKTTSPSMGRYRRGSRGSGTAEAVQPVERTDVGADDSASAPAAAPADAPADSSAAGLTPDRTELVERMARSYQGVGRRTAERLVAEFGKSVMDVIDNEPGRIEKILPRGRAQAVIDGRRAEREAAGDS